MLDARTTYLLFTYYKCKNKSSLKTDALSSGLSSRGNFKYDRAYGFPLVIENSLIFIWFCFIFYNY